MEQKELCQWLRANSAGTYRPSAMAADEIERLQNAWDSAFQKANENGGRVAQLQVELRQRLKGRHQMMNRKFLESLMDSHRCAKQAVHDLTTDVVLCGDEPGASRIHEATVVAAKAQLAELTVLLDQYWETHNA